MKAKSELFKPKVVGGFAQRGHRGRKKARGRLKPPLSIKQILAWADAHYARTGNWPQANFGRIHDSPHETWIAVEDALRGGFRGLPGGSSLAKLLAERRGVRNPCSLPPLWIEQILAWADAHHERTGKWPNSGSGRIHGAPLCERWRNVDKALNTGTRGLPGGMSLAKLLIERRGMRSKFWLPKLTVEQILAWADAHHERTGKWPNLESGKIYEEPSETWVAISHALRSGCRGLRGGGSLSRLLMKHRGRRNQGNLPKLTVRKILAWADAYHARTGQWPRFDSGPVEGAGGETWSIINVALFAGRRGLPRCSSLAYFLHRYRKVPNRRFRPPLRIETILKWADAHYRRTGCWRTSKSGPVEAAQGEKWHLIAASLRQGQRGLPAGLVLRQLLATRRGERK